MLPSALERVGRFDFRVIGVLEHDDRFDDLRMITPLGTARAYIGGDLSLSEIVVESTSPDTAESALNQVYAVLDAKRGIREPSARDYTAKVLWPW
ncbi:MAG: ABC transporter permease [Actinomycetes bacterium]